MYGFESLVPNVLEAKEKRDPSSIAFRKGPPGEKYLLNN